MISQELLLLKIIEVNGSFSLLRERGFSSSQIALMLQDQERAGNITLDEFGVHLTDSGRTSLATGFSEIKYGSKESWVLPRETLYQEPMSPWEVVLPPRI